MKQTPCKMFTSPVAASKEFRKTSTYCDKTRKKPEPLKPFKIVKGIIFMNLLPKKSVCGKELQSEMIDYSKYIEKISKDKELICQLEKRIEARRIGKSPETKPGKFKQMSH